MKAAAAFLGLGLAATAQVSLAQDPPPPAPAPAASPPPYGSMQAGGLAPPPPLPADSQPLSQSAAAPSTENPKKKEGRGLTWVWLEAEAGFEHVGLQTFNVDEQALTAGFVASSSSGGVIGAGLGARLVFVTLGARARIGFFDAWQLFSFGGELGFRIPIGNVEPHLAFGAGYSALGSFSGAVSGAADAISISGYHARFGAGVDYFIVPAFSIGLAGSFELLGLTRPALDSTSIERIKASGGAGATQADLLAVEGTSYGGALAITAVAGVHF